MDSLEVWLYAATVEIFDDRYPADVQPVRVTTRLDLDPIPNSETWFAEYHCRCVVWGGQGPSYTVYVPEGELIEVEYPVQGSNDADAPPPRVRTLLRTPDLKAADGLVVLSCCQYGLYGFRQVPVEGGKVIERLPNPLIPNKPSRQSKPRPTKRRTVGQVAAHYQRSERPVVYSGRTAQASLFAPEPEPVLVNGRLPDGTLPGQTSFLD